MSFKALPGTLFKDFLYLGADNLPYEKVGENEPVCIADEVPFEIPESWEWVRVKEFTSLYNGRAFKPSDWTEVGLPIVRIQNLNNPSAPYNHYNGEVESDYLLHGGELLFAWSGTPGTSFGAHIWNRGEAVLNQHIFRLEFDEHLLYKPYYMQALNQRVGELIQAAHGSAGLQHVTKGVFESTLIPLPPVNEQMRIVEKLDEIEPFVSKYGGLNDNLESMNTAFPDQLKKSILQMAVQGKLVPQDPADEPASILLERIRAEKEQLIRQGKIKRDKYESVIFRRDNSHYEKRNSEEVCIDDEIPFDLPDSWEWRRLGSILQKLTDGTHSTPKYVKQGIPFISVKDISSGKLLFDSTKHITIEEHCELYKRCDPQRGDILLSKVGTTGIPVIVDTDIEFSLFVSVAQLRFSHDLLDAEYLILLLKSPLVQKQCTENTRGVGNKNWVMRDIANTLIAIPPLSEQRRIAKFFGQIAPYIERISAT